MIYHKIEQINVSDSEYQIIEIMDPDENLIKKNTVIYSYESSKSSSDEMVEEDCYVYFNPEIMLEASYPVGTIVAVSSKNKLDQSELEKVFFESSSSLKEQLTDDIIITNKAKALIELHKIELSNFAGLEVINEEAVLGQLKKGSFENEFQHINYYHDRIDYSIYSKRLKKLAIIGAGKAALQVFDAVIEAKEYQPTLFYDNNEDIIGKKIMGISVRSKIDMGLIKQDFDAGLFDAIIISFSGNIQSRKVIFDKLIELNIPIANIIHPTAHLSNFTNIGVGNLIFSNVRIGPFAVIGNNNVLSSYCSIEHHNLLGSHNTFGPSVLFSGSCSVRNCNKFGTGIFIEPNIKIGSSNIISSGIVLTSNLEDETLVKNSNKYEIRKLQ
jgi:acetyltransferase-like isoleucine patch superfamily enzyme